MLCPNRKFSSILQSKIPWFVKTFSLPRGIPDESRTPTSPAKITGLAMKILLGFLLTSDFRHILGTARCAPTRPDIGEFLK